MKSLSSGVAAMFSIALCVGFSETVKDREGAVRKDRAVMENDARWIYNDYDRAFAKAKQSGKPLLAVLRCVPCLACAGIDAQVLEEPSLAPLLDQFVCVRVINANALDLARFQFDYDLSFSTIFFNADGTVYGRYGSWTHQKDPQDKTTAGFKKALEGALATHRNYPANKSLLAGKQGVALPFKTPVEMPTIAGKYSRELNWDGKVVQSCVHCHQIGDALRVSYRDKKQPIPEEWIYPFPMPETIGLTLAGDHPARVAAVAAGSIAAKSGLHPGDDIVTLGGQPLLSAADVSWVLHRAPVSGNLPAAIRRGGTQTNANLVLPPQWRKSSDISRRVGTWPMRAMAFGGMVLEDLSDEERARRNLPKDKPAFYVKHVGQYNQHAAAKNAGFKKEDVIVEIDGFTKRSSEGELIGHLLQKHPKGERLKVVALRGEDKVALMLPLQ
jgi:serine protease Do